MVALTIVMPALVAGIHVFGSRMARKTWMAGSKRAFTPVMDGLRPAMTRREIDAR